VTEEQLAEAVGWVARCRRWEHVAETTRSADAAVQAERLRAKLRGYNIEIEPRGWRPPVAIEQAP
jgi:hypothetical protein